jgi:hypothetical protein
MNHLEPTSDHASTPVEAPVPGPGVIALAVYQPDLTLLERQLQSLQAQQLTNWTCIIGIDGFDEETYGAVRRLTRDDERFHVEAFADNVGFYRNFERLLERVDQGVAWVALADQDDVWDPAKLRILVECMVGQSASLAVCQARIVDAAGEIIGRTDRQHVSLATLILDNQVTGSLAVLDPAVLAVALPFPRPDPSSYHDHWLGVVASALNGFVVVDEVLQSYVQHGGNVIGEERGSALRARLMRLLEGGPSAAVNRLARQRWGWRQRMAQEIGRRVPSAREDPAVCAIATGGMSRVLARELAAAARAGTVGHLRLVGLGVGATLSKHSRPRDQDRNVRPT